MLFNTFPAKPHLTKCHYRYTLQRLIYLQNLPIFISAHSTVNLLLGIFKRLKTNLRGKINLFGNEKNTKKHKETKKHSETKFTRECVCVCKKLYSK